MSSKHPIVRELIRQQEQGFVEPKIGYLSDYLFFKIIAQRPGDYILKIRHDNVEFRKILDSEDLEEEYEPFHALMHSLATVIGDEGTARASYPSNNIKGTWKLKNPEPLADALDHYRFNSFDYLSGDIKVDFYSLIESNVTRGELSITFPFSEFTDLNPQTIHEVMKIFHCL